MHDEHDRTHGHGVTARPRGRMPYGDPPLRQPPPPAGQPPSPPSHTPEAPRATGAPRLPEPLEPAPPPESRAPVGPPSTPEWSEWPEGEGAKVPRRPARHRKDEESGEEGESGDACPPIRDSLTYLDSRPFSMPPPPGPWRPRLSREQLLRPALIAGLLAAAGVGVWSSGWSPWDGVPTAGTSPASPGEGLLQGHDIVITPSRAPGVDVKVPPEAHEGGKGSPGKALDTGEGPDTKAPRGRAHEEGPGLEKAGRAGGGGGRAAGRAPVRTLPAERALSHGGDTANKWVERVERARAARKPAERPVRHREGGSARTAAGSRETGNAASRTGAGRENGRRTGGAERRRPGRRDGRAPGRGRAGRRPGRAGRARRPPGRRPPRPPEAGRRPPQAAGAPASAPPTPAVTCPPRTGAMPTAYRYGTTTRPGTACVDPFFRR